MAKVIRATGMKETAPRCSPPDGRTAAIVVTWNRCDLLRATIPCLVAQSLPFARIIVVDNGSRDGTADRVGSMPGTELVTLPANRGFAAGCNAGIRCVLGDASIDRIALINNDVLLEPDWHREALCALLASPAIGSCATVLVKQADPSIIDTAGIAWRFPGWADNHLPGRPATDAGDTVQEIFGACAGAALYRRAFFDDVGLFDEALFAYHEDVDLALRGRLRAWRCVLAPRARGSHAGFGSNRPFPLGGTYADYYNARNRPHVLVKSMSGEEWRRHGWRVLKRHLLQILRSFPERRAAAVLAGSVHALLRLPRALRARSAVFAARKPGAEGSREEPGE